MAHPSKKFTLRLRRALQRFAQLCDLVVSERSLMRIVNQFLRFLKPLIRRLNQQPSPACNRRRCAQMLIALRPEVGAERRAPPRGFPKALRIRQEDFQERKSLSKRTIAKKRSDPLRSFTLEPERSFGYALKYRIPQSAQQLRHSVDASPKNISST